MNTQKMAATPTVTIDEHILVVKRELLFSHQPAWSGVNKTDFAPYMDLIGKHKEFLPRSLMETDQSYKQIIPYLIFKHQDTYFLMQRTAQSTEQRLKNNYSLGIGGHVRQEDLEHNSIFDWARREFHEEVSYNDAFTIEPFGILNDDSNDVGKVHIGFVFIVHGTTTSISVKSELKSGVLCTLDTIKKSDILLEPWSAMVVDLL